MEKVIEARDYISKTESSLDEDGYWKVVVTIIDRVKYKGSEEWVEEIVEAMSMDRVFAHAIQVAMSSALGVIVDEVYNKDFQGLVEAREAKRLEEAGTNASEVTNN